MYPLPPNDAERLTALHDLDVLHSPPEPQFDAICRTAQALFGVPIALVSLVGESEQWFKARCGWQAEGTPRAISFCTYAILRDDVMVVEDAARDHRFSESPLVTDEPRIRFYAGAPLVLSPGIRVGTLCIIDTATRAFSPEQARQLSDLAQVVVAQLRLNRAERDARLREAEYRLLADNTTDMIVRSDLDGTRRYVSPACERLLGYAPEELVGTRPLDFVHPDDADGYARLLGELRQGLSSQALTQQRYRRRDGSWVWVEISFCLTRSRSTGRPDGYVAVLRDISERKAAEEKAVLLARHDPLTGLPNRLHFRESLEREIARCRRNAGGFALLCLDLDRFKLVNDTLGHQAGDALLCVVAERLKAVLRAEDTVARLGGDEFVIVQTGEGRAADAQRLAERLIAAMVPPVDLNGYPAGIGVSVGIALAPQDGDDPDQLFARADQALYRAKADGRNTFRFHANGDARVALVADRKPPPAPDQPMGLIRPEPLFVSELLRDILETCTDCVTLIDQGGGLLFLSTGGLRAMQIDDVSPYLGRAWVDLWQGEHHAAALSAVEEAREAGSARFRGFCRTARGEPKWWDVSLNRLRDHGSTRGLMLIISRDVTAQVGLETDLQTTARRYKALIDATATMVWRAEPDGALIEISGWETYTGQAPGASRGFGWAGCLHPEDLDRVSARWREIVASRSPGTCEFRVRRSDGEYRWFLARVVPLTDAAGKIQEWVGTTTDIHDGRRAGELIRSQEERYRLALMATQDAAWDHDLSTDTITWSERAQALFGYGEAQIDRTGAWWRNAIHPEDRRRVTASLREVVDGQGDLWSDTYRFARGDGSFADVLDRGFMIRDAHGRVVRVVGAMHDMTEQRRADLALRASEERLRLALRAGRMVAWERSSCPDPADRSENGVKLLGLGTEPFSVFLDRVHPEDRAAVKAFFEGGKHHEHLEYRYVTAAGRTIWLSGWAEWVGQERIVGITLDITERKLAEEKAWRAANHDALTGLPNRKLFHQRFEQAVSAAEEGGSCVSLLLVDLDRLRDVNETHGHDAGDAVLCETARRLGDGLRAADLVARLGGDEFAILLTEPLRLEHAANHAQVLIERLRQPFEHRGRTLSCRASIGLAGYPDHHRDAPEMLKAADMALHRAKMLGRSRAVVFDLGLRAATETRIAIADEVRSALAEGRIVPFYQPKVCLGTGRIAGFEALARWQHPDKGLLTPGYFGSVFEDPEIATALSDSLLRQILRDMRTWRDDGLDFGRVAVNVSSAEFQKPDLAGSMLEALASFGVPAALFEAEVTETVFLGHGSESVPGTLRRLHDQGVMVTLDDFGTGFASLTHLKQFPVSHIKVDQSFVRDLERDEDDAAIVAAVIGLGRSLGMQVTAEGVETEAQARRLRAMRCDYAQGYLYARPMAGSRVPRLLSTWSPEAGARGAAPGEAGAATVDGGRVRKNA
ncbi:diguanylate cyclase domain-containing protein [Methylobacterium sp. Gmos1]